MSDIIEYRVERGVAVITMQRAPVNAMGLPLRSALLEAVSQAEADSEVQAILLTSGLGLFSAGADLDEFDSDQAYAHPSLPWLYNRIEIASKLVVAGINGAALGGGLELALTADYRVAADSAKLGLPEVKLGIIPGAGGTQRVPRLTGVDFAIDMMVSGNPISAAKALDASLIDHVVPAEEGVAGMIAYVCELLEGAAPRRSCLDAMPDTAALPAGYFETKTAQVKKAARGFEAPLKVVEAVEIACQKPLSEGLDDEWRLFKGMMDHPEARAMQHIFAAERQVYSIPGVEPKGSVREVRSVGVIGAGTMGGGIAMNFLNAGIPVVLLDAQPEGLERGVKTIRGNYERSASRGKLTAEQVESRMELLTPSTDYAALAEVDLVIEAVFEDMSVKHAVFKQLDTVCKPGAILASNTSTLDVNEIAAVTSRPGDVVGMHFFSPANVMRLLEVVRADKTSEEVLRTVLAVAKTIRKLPVTVGVCYGFVGNRMVAPYSREAFRLLLEGATPEQVDGALTAFGMAMGPVSMADMAGIDIGCMAAEANREDWQDDASYQALQFKLREMGRLGQKTQMGVYRYEGRDKISDPEFQTLCESLAAELGIERRDISQKEITERCIFALINEGADILSEGIASRYSDIDMIYLNGYGFPAYRGGPMHYANEIGLDFIVQRFEHYREALGEYGERWFRISPYLQSALDERKRFAA